LARGKEVIVSRGQLVEIGGSFRIPDVMEQSGCKLVDVGTTNKTYISDYEKKIGPATGLLLKVHTSNFRIVGFTASPSLEELIALGRKHSLPVMDDLGSGAMVDMARFGIQGEPGVADSVKAGADVITFSGDKLLGGPQAGILLGSKKWMGAIRKNPLFRALRVDKLTLTALEATLKLYFDPDRLFKEVPTLAMLGMAPEEIERRALELASKLKPLPGVSVEILDDSSEVGGGSVPAHALPTKVVALRLKKLSLEAVAPPLDRRAVGFAASAATASFDVRTLLEGEADGSGGGSRLKPPRSAKVVTPLVNRKRTVSTNKGDLLPRPHRVGAIDAEQLYDCLTAQERNPPEDSRLWWRGLPQAVRRRRS
jgi:L-seryl-tRNA(Ser) seleniumtransferase